jgi:hypothetical protein
VVQSGFAPGVTRWNLKDRVAASASNRIGLDLYWSRLAALSCWPGLPSELKRTSLTLSGVARYLAGPSVPEPCLFLAPRLLAHAPGQLRTFVPNDPYETRLAEDSENEEV